MKGGPRKGAGRPKAAPTIPVRFNLPPDLHAEYLARGGPNWVRRLMAQDLEPWHPIETAPKDCRILLADGDVVTVGWWEGDRRTLLAKGHAVEVGRWEDAEDEEVDRMGANAGFVDCNFQHFLPGRHSSPGNQPAHWKPMPAGPKAKAKA